MPQALGREQPVVSTESIRNWFLDFKIYIDSLDPTLLQHPERMFSADEYGFSICPASGKVLAPVSQKHLSTMTSTTRSQITVLACSSAAGEYLPPLMIFPQQDLRFDPLEGFKRAVCQWTENGWISAEVFLAWLKNVFLPAVEDKPKPVILFVDDHTSLVTSLESFELCQEQGVILYCLRAHSSPLMQPLDQTCFGALKRAWSKAVKRFSQDTGEEIAPQTFSKVFSSAWKEAAKPESAFFDFVRSGLFPFNPSVVVASAKMKFGESFDQHKPEGRASESPSTSKAVASPEATPQQSMRLLEKLDILEEILAMGSEVNTKNIRRMRKGYALPNLEFSRWRDLVLRMFGPQSSPPVPKPPQLFSSQSVISPEIEIKSSPPFVPPGPRPPHLFPSQPLISQGMEIEPTMNSRIPAPSSPSSEKCHKTDGCQPMDLSSQSYMGIIQAQNVEANQRDGQQQGFEKKKRKCDQGVTRNVREETREPLKVKITIGEKKAKGQLEEQERKRKEKEERKSQKGKGSGKNKTLVEDETNSVEYECEILAKREPEVGGSGEDGQAIEVREIALGICRGCHGDEENTDMVNCAACDGRWHVVCVKGESVKREAVNELVGFEFFCEGCTGK